MMGGPASPIDITTPTRHASSSPSSQNQKTSNLTSALQFGRLPQGDDAKTSVALNIGGTGSNGFNSSPVGGRHDSFSGGNSGMTSNWAGGARPISVKNPNKEKPRRESIAGSLVGGMSWGGVSVGSWIRDDIIMAGTSPFTYQSPSYHSSSYLPKLEANFMRDFSCCGVTLPSLHDLLQHYEESHAQQIPQSVQRGSQSGQSGQSAPPSNKAALAAGAAAAVQQQAQLQAQQQQQQQQQQQEKQQQQQTQQPKYPVNPLSGQSSGIGQMSGIQLMRQQQQGQLGGFKTSLQTVEDMDTVEDMEMDDEMDEGSDVTPPPPTHQQAQLHQQQQGQLGQQQSRAAPSLNLMTSNNMANPMQAHQGLRTSQPTTPATAVHHALPYPHNPTVSSVNTPTLSTQAMQQQQPAFSPETSVPGTPGELDDDYSTLPADMSMPTNSQYLQGNFGYGFPGGNDMLDLCIDEPAKRLFSPNGGFNNQQYAQFRMQGGQFGNSSELARRIREQQMMAGLASASAGLIPGEEIKPFRCPVIGCEKAYKNQNGLKYHKTHGHTNQQLHENADGTFSIVNPETCVPYPGTLGMEKEKPYRCEICGKRYKNLNGLKYHKAHSPPCNPELKLGGVMGPGAGAVGMQSLGINLASGGLGGIGEEPMIQ